MTEGESAVAAQGPTDADLAARLRARDPDALGALYDRYVAGIHDFLARFTRDHAAAEDLTQTTFLRAWERRAALRDPARVRAWLYATAHHLALNHVTRTRRTAPIEAGGDMPDPAPGPEREALAREAAELVWAAAASLEPRQYAVLDLSVRRGLSTREVADVLEVPVGHAAVLVNRAREALGNAVRYLLVARRRDHCARLAALVPAGVRVLTARERSAVDHHLRRCPDCRDLGGELTSAAELFGALLPMPVPAALGAGARLKLVAAAHAAGGAGAAARAGNHVWPPRRWPWDVPRGWAAALAVLVVLSALGGGAALRFRPAPGERASLPAAPPALAQASPAPSAVPSPLASPDPASPPVPVALTVQASPTPVPAPPPPTAAPAPGPPLAVGAVALTWNDAGACSRVGRGFACHFTVTVTVQGANGRDAVAGTVVAVTQRERVTVRLPSTVPAPGATTVTLGATATFRSTPCGLAAATTDAPNRASSRVVPFGSCPLLEIDLSLRL